ncbi:PP2C family protein-serine/threonine phosphatase [Actinomycetospora soli]|uniref:PP2C family protein-serine/threonine phosphatase n=1 Tax=Actinomycetospora soli TaxID=2893887 RepID=UPI001E4674DF|nr:PP2C family serine/threonine-protein phosphatase [Actinomycetospora soli]MCD2187856.1 serine/threonine-protein phosphatase [Actinomycetospora soli]
MTATLDIAALTHRGALRKANEDCLLLGSLVAADVDLPEPVVMRLVVADAVTVALADGMGGHAGGQVASRTVVQLLASSPIKHAAVDSTRTRLADIDADLTDLAARRASLAEMGTTVAGVVADPATCVWFSVGDSRVFQIRAGYVAQLSTDDSAPSGTTKGALLSWLGPRPRGTLPTPAVEPLDRSDGVRWLLCSDGLSDVVGVTAMEDILRRTENDAEAVRGLFAAAMAASAPDNVSVVLIRPQGFAQS